MPETNRDAVGRALDLLSLQLASFIERVALPKLPPETDWPAMLDGAGTGEDRSSDVRLQLRMLIEPVGAYGYLCEDDLTGAATRTASELLSVADQFAKGSLFSVSAAGEAIERCARLLQAIGAGDDAALVRELHVRLVEQPAVEPPTPDLTTAILSQPIAMTDAPDSGLIGEAAVAQGVRLELSAMPILSYAIAHNRVPVIRQIAIRQPSEPVRGAQLQLGIEDADGAVGESTTILVDLEPGVDTTLTDVEFRLDARAMLQIEDRRPGVLRARLVIEEAEIASTSVDVWLLAANQWLALPPSLSLEMLAAFVMPNHPAIAALMDDVSRDLGVTTGNPAIQGYQAGPERVDQIVCSIFRVMKDRNIRYSEPPASWADTGQKVRTPGDVLEGRVGTCLDTLVTMAAALEDAGIRPLLWVVEGHAFLGYWREERSLPGTAQTDVSDVVNLIDLGLIRLVETTLVTNAGKAASMEEAHRIPYDTYLTGSLERVLGVNDLYRARKDGIVALPARRRNDDGTVVVTEYRPAASGLTGSLPQPSVESNRAAAHERRHVPARIAQWKNALLDLSLRNRLINFPDSARINLTVAGGLLAGFEDAINQGTSVHLLPSDQIAEVHRARGLRYGRELPPEQLAELLIDRRSVYTDLTEAAYPSRLRNLAYAAKTVTEETGANNLYLAFGSLHWSLDGRPLRSPLILIPVHLTAPARTGGYRLALDEAGASTPNYCLLEKLRQVHDLEIPGLIEPVEDGSGIDLDAALTATREAIARHQLPYRVEATVDLAILQFAKFRLWKDLDEHWDAFSANPLVKHLIFSPTEPFQDPTIAPAWSDLDQLAAESPMPADSSQLAAVAEASAMRTFVLEGPPGTGKSQTITNLLTRAIADGKRVLFVAEKRAALDVVQKRLLEVGLGPLCLDLHDKGSKPSAVRAQLREALEYHVDTDAEGMTIDLDTLNASRGSLTRYARRLHERNGVGHSLYSARTQLLASGDLTSSMPISEAFAAGATREDVEQMRLLLARLPEVADPAHPRKHHPWGFIDCAQGDAIDPATIRLAAIDFDEAITALPRDGQVSAVIEAIRTPDEFAVFAALLAAAPLSIATLDAARTPGWKQNAGSIVADIAAVVAGSHPALERVTADVLQLPLATIHDDAEAAANSGFFGRGKRVGAVRDRIAPFFRPGVQVDGKQLPDLTAELLEMQNQVRGLAARASSIPGLTIPDAWNPWSDDGRELIARQVQWLQWAGSVVDPDGQGDRLPMVQELRRYFAREEQPDDTMVAAIGRASAACQRLCVAGDASRDAVFAWSGDAGFAGRWEMTRAERKLDQERLPALQAWIALVQAVEPMRKLRLEAARRSLLRGEITAEDAVRAFERGIAAASMEERSAATGLDLFDAVAQEKTVDRFTASSVAVRSHLRTALPKAVLDARTFDATATAGQVGLLQRQLSRQRGGMGVRALMTNFGELIARITPCVLVSPDSVARFFPAKADLFDIVVFDEASQIRVADAVGAMGRGHSVVVVGDSKQMPPTSFAEPTGGQDELAEQTIDFVEDEESILSEAVQARVPRHWLSWHYRSQDEALIAFSNQHYYESKLSSFPAPVQGPADPGVDGHGVSLLLVDGVFHRSGKGKLLRTNPIEAEAVVAAIRERFAESPDRIPSLGVVTFNAQQRSSIEALLRDCGDPRIVEALDSAVDGLFVKNLENVQGDERDTIFFSTGFSVNDRGYLPLNFGPLNRAGGERRLNVAITRARRQVVVFSSFAPELLRAEETTSVGIKHLRAYLDLAQQGTMSLPQDTRRRAFPDRHREEIADALRMRGYLVRSDVGLSEFKIDLIVAAADAPEQPVMAILLDGPRWAERRTTGDRDGLPTEVLSALLRWPAVERIWLPAWLNDRETVLADIDQSFDAARERIRQQDECEQGVGEPAPGDPTPVQSSTPVELLPRNTERGAVDVALKGLSAVNAPMAAPVGGNNHVPGASPFIPWNARRLGGVDVLDRLPSADAGRQVRAALTEIVAAEGPIHPDRLVKLVATGFGLARVSEARKAAIIWQLDSNSWRDPLDGVIWPVGIDAATWTTFRVSESGNERPLEHIGRREMANAMAAICRNSAGIPEKALKRETLQLFNGKRMTANASGLLEEALAHGVASNRLRKTNAGLIEVA